MQAQAAKLALAHAARQPPLVHEPIDETHGAQLGEEGCIEVDLVKPAQDLARAGRRLAPLARIDLNDENVFRGGRTQERNERGVTAVAAVPVRDAVDLHRTEYERQARGRRYGLSSYFFPRENANLSGVHVGRRDAPDVKPAIFEQLIERSPGKRTMRAAALEREIDPLAPISRFGPPRRTHLR